MWQNVMAVFALFLHYYRVVVPCIKTHGHVLHTCKSQTFSCIMGFNCEGCSCSVPIALLFIHGSWAL